MEDSGEVHSDGNKVPLDMKQKRTLKTPAQRHALEVFYQEHKFPTDEMKAQLAEKVGLTEKQISSWFCHRRLKDKRKDEAHVNGRQDHSSGVIHDRASVLRQDSCGSIKQGDYRSMDLREVESQGIYGRNLPATDFTLADRGHQDPHGGDMDDTSSESSSSLQDRVFSHSSDPYVMQTSSYVTQSRAIMPREPVAARTMGYKPSGYLKVKGDIENPAITAVKRQLGRLYREDGPPLGIEFEALPPGAFESPTTNPVNEKNYVGDSNRSRSLGISEVLREPNLITRYEADNSRLVPQDSYEESANDNSVHTDRPERSSYWPPKHKKPFLHKLEDSAGKISASDSISSRMNSTRTAEGMGSDTISNYPGCYDGKIFSKKAKSRLHDENFVAGKSAQKNAILSRSPNFISGFSQSLDAEERGPSARIPKGEKHIIERKPKMEHLDLVRAKMHPTNGMRAPKRGKVEYRQQDCPENPPSTYMQLPTDQIKRSSMNVSSSFSEEETAETSSS